VIDFDKMSDQELRKVIADAPHLRWWDTINMAVHLAKMAQEELERRGVSEIPSRP
jgi:hypothetical protein